MTVLAPSGRAAELQAGRRALARGELADVVALGLAVPVSRRSSLGVPVGVRANLALALRGGAFDVVHGIDPGVPSLSYIALLEAETLTAATFLSVDRLGYPTRRRSETGCSRASTRSSRPRTRSLRPRPSASPASTACSRPAWTSPATRPAASGT